MSFDGDGDYINAGNNSGINNLHQSGAITAELWVKLTKLSQHF